MVPSRPNNVEMCTVCLGALFFLLNSKQYFCTDQSTNFDDPMNQTMHMSGSMDQTTDFDVSTKQTTDVVGPTNTTKFDCDNKQIPYVKELEPIWGLEKFYSFSELVYDNNVNRTEFVYAVLKNEMIVSKSIDCPKHPDTAANDDMAQLIDHRFGGPCTMLNTFPLNTDCNKGMWDAYTKQLAVHIKEKNIVLFCVKLVYDDRLTTRPKKIIAAAYTMAPEKKYISSIIFENPVSDKCNKLNEDSEVVRMSWFRILHDSVLSVFRIPLLKEHDYRSLVQLTITNKVNEF